MIEIKEVSKSFDDIHALDKVSMSIEESKVFGLIGTNGAGKSTLLRLLAGILKSDKGEIIVDNETVYENDELKQNIFFMSDDQYYLPSGAPKDMAGFYACVYRDFDYATFDKLLQVFKLEKDRKINTFSKGMKKQLLVVLALSSKAKYLLCDETFDGLDPVVRQATKSLFISEMEKRNLTPIIASHNLRELEDICDNIGMMYQGGIILNDSLDDMKLKLSKVQCVFKDSDDFEKLKERLNVLDFNKRGSLYTLTLRGTNHECSEMIREFQPVFYENLPLSLEEIYISETEVMGYGIKESISKLD